MNAMRTIVLLYTALLIAGCGSGPPTRLVDSTDTVLAAPLNQVKTALVSVLSADGYPVRESYVDDRVVMTGYRREIEGLWDWLLKSRFGVGRSKVEATMSPESQDTTRLTVSVIYEAKDHLWSAWQETTPPPHRSATLQLRSIKKALGLLQVTSPTVVLGSGQSYSMFEKLFQSRPAWRGDTEEFYAKPSPRRPSHRR